MKLKVDDPAYLWHVVLARVEIQILRAERIFFWRSCNHKSLSSYLGRKCDRTICNPTHERIFHNPTRQRGNPTKSLANASGCESSLPYVFRTMQWSMPRTVREMRPNVSSAQSKSKTKPTWLLFLVKWSLAILICKVGVGIVVNYVDYFPPNFQSDFLVGRRAFFHGLYRAAFYVHIVSAPLVLFLGLVLISELGRKRYLRLHRILGRVQVSLVLLCVVPSGMVMSYHSLGGSISGYGFFTSSILTAICISMGWRRALQRRFAAHRVWMMRSYILLCSAVTLRLMGGISTLMHFEPFSSYQFAAWASWLVPLIFFELFEMRKRVRAIDYR
jgi:uncharacterized membrane protein